MRIPVALGACRVVCEVARTAEEQARGLQGHPGLREGEGMLFPFHPPRAACFHMGKVAFAIDILFADGSGRVQKIVHGVEPGSRARWSFGTTGAVVELPAGTARRLGVSVGDQVTVAGRRLGAQTYNLLRTLTEADVHEGDGATGPGLQDGFYSKEPQHPPPDFGGAPNGIGPDRFIEHNLPPDGGNPNAMNQPNSYWMDVGGRDVGYYSDTITNDLSGQPPPGIDADNEPAATRMSAGAQVAGRRAQDMSGRARPTSDTTPPSYNIDMKKMGPAILEAAFRAGMKWEPNPTNPAEERLNVSPDVLGNWLHSLGLPDADRDEMHDALVTPQGLRAIGDVFTVADVATGATIKPWGHIPILVLTRGKTPELPAQQEGN